MVPKFSLLPWLLQVVVLSVGLLGITAGYLYCRYGSWAAAEAALNDQSLVALPSRVNLGVVNVDTMIPFEVIVANHTAQPVSILGIDKRCGIMLDSSSLFVVPAHSQQPLRLSYFANGRVGEPFCQSLTLVTSCDYNWPMIEVSGVISATLIPVPDPLPDP